MWFTCGAGRVGVALKVMSRVLSTNEWQNFFSLLGKVLRELNLIRHLNPKKLEPEQF
jgi:hypothetical protein